MDVGIRDTSVRNTHFRKAQACPPGAHVANAVNAKTRPLRNARIIPMPMLPSRHYVSDHTQFIRELIEAKPDLPRKQLEGRRIWWDKSPDDLTAAHASASAWTQARVPHERRTSTRAPANVSDAPSPQEAGVESRHKRTLHVTTLRLA